MLLRIANDDDDEEEDDNDNDNDYYNDEREALGDTDKGADKDDDDE